MVEYSKVSEERQRLKFEDTNLANFGSELEFKIKKNASEKEEAWIGSNKHKGLKIWRIEKFQIKPIASDLYSYFYDGDSYIILHNKVEIINGEEKLTHRVFMWIGEYSSQDEYGTAAYKTVELDDYLDRKATLYREVQGYESFEFLALFNNKIQIMKGGIDSGFIHVEKSNYDNYPGKLLHIRKNGNNYRITEVKLCSSSLNNDDCFILDKMNKIFLFKGSKCSKFESFKAASMTKELKDSRKTIKSDIIVIENDNDNSLKEDNEEVNSFWKCLGGKPNKIKDDEEGNEDNNKDLNSLKIIKCSDESGKMVKSLVDSATKCSDHKDDKKFKKSVLDSNDTFLVTDGNKIIYAWVGSKTSFNEKKYAFILASEFIKENNYPGHISISVVNEGNEVADFKKLFC